MPPTPTPLPSPTPAPALLAPTRTLAEDLLGSAGWAQNALRPLFLLVLELVLLVIGFVVVRWILRRLLNQTLGTMAEREEQKGNTARAARLRTLHGLLRALLLWTLGFSLAVSLLSLLGVNVTAIVGTAGIAGLAFGFGAQKLVKDVITGFFLLLEDQYIAGDYVTIGSVSGVVESLEMRVTRIRDDEGRLHILSNGDIATVCNHTRGAIQGSFEIGIAANADRTLATQTLNAALATASATLHLTEIAAVAGITSADAAKTTLKITFRAAPGQRPMLLVSTLREAALNALQQAAIPLG